MSWGSVPVQLDWLNSALSPEVHGEIAQSIKTQYKTISLFVGLFICLFAHQTNMDEIVRKC